MVLGEAMRSTLIDRVARKVSGHGITRCVMAGAADRVPSALRADAAASAASASILDQVPAAEVGA